MLPSTDLYGPQLTLALTLYQPRLYSLTRFTFFQRHNLVQALPLRLWTV
jgi:hypothetical protein